MLCPKCGAYSPYNTSVCNRCGSKLSADGSAKSSGRTVARRHYRNARPTEWEKKRSDLIARANDGLDNILADSKKRIILLAAAAIAALMVLGSAVGCVSCMCGGCAESETTPDPGSTGETSFTDVLPSLPPLDPVSGADIISGGDAVSPSDEETSDKVIIVC